MKTLTHNRLNSLADEARASSRLRMNHNLHEELGDPVQRLAIAMEPATFVRPHRHSQTWEVLTALRGRFVVLGFDDQGTVTQRVVLGEDTAVVETPAGDWHAVLSLDSGGVIFEVKQGPYRPFSPDDFAPWVPDAEAQQAALMDWYRHAAVGQSWPQI